MRDMPLEGSYQHIDLHSFAPIGVDRMSGLIDNMSRLAGLMPQADENGNKQAVIAYQSDGGNLYLVVPAAASASEVLDAVALCLTA